MAADGELDRDAGAKDVDVDGKTSSVLSRIAKAGLKPELELGIPDTAEWGDVVIGGSVTSVAVAGGVLRIRAAGDPASIVWKRRDELKEAKPAVALGWAAGAAARAEVGVLKSVGFGDDWGFEIEGHEATASTGPALPRYWAVPLALSWRELHGNLVVQGKGANRIEGSQNNLRLEGAYTYYLIETRAAIHPNHVLVVDVGHNGCPDRQLVAMDIEALAFTLGQPLAVTELFGITEDNRTCAWLGLGYDKYRGTARRSKSPVPTRQFREPFVAAMFSCVSKALRADPGLLSVALAYYVEALLEPHLDGAYLKLQVALEATAYRVAGSTSGAVVIVKDRAEWGKWVQAAREDLAKLAAPGEEKALIGKVRNAAFIPSGRRVEGAFKRFGIELTEDVRREIALRNVVAHAALMSEPDKRDIRRDLQRVAQVQTLLAALVALAVGYKGRLTGWAQDAAGGFDDPPAVIWNPEPVETWRYWVRYELDGG